MDSVTFEDMAVNFTLDKWACWILPNKRKSVYRNVMQETFRNLATIERLFERKEGSPFGETFRTHPNKKTSPGVNPCESSVCGIFIIYMPIKPVTRHKPSEYEECRQKPCTYKQREKTFSYLHYFGIHERSSTGKKYDYKEYGKTFISLTGFQNHMITHTGEKTYECKEYRKAFIHIHKRTHTGEKLYQCKQCGKAFAEESVARKHTRDRPCKCKVYGKSFYSPGSFQRYGRHNTGEKPYECKGTHWKAFRPAKFILIHEKTHIGKKLYNPKNVVKTFICSTSFQTHGRPHTGEKSYECNHCSKVFRSAKGIQLHERTCTGKKPYECKQCGKAFHYHKRTHTSEKHWKWKPCGKVISSTSFQIHERIHTGKKSYECKQCVPTYMKGLTKEKPYKCKSCSIAF
uniref:Zinc finger protein 709-like n=1 Tax=Otolemur garnettii TaxID=30611 RepID=H0Y1W5_OTOGA